MPIPVASAVGQHGSWFAHVQGEALPCVHTLFFDPATQDYADPNFDASSPKWRALLEALQRTQKAILTRDNVRGEQAVARLSYLAVRAVRDVRVDGTTLRFRFGEVLSYLR